MNISESIILALDSIRANKLRASLTLLSISIGVFAIIGAGTLVNSINNAVTNEMASLGENTFEIKKMPSIQMGNTWRKYRNRKSISITQFRELKKRMTLTENISCYSASDQHTIKTKNYSTDPDVVVIGCDDIYFTNNNINIDQGRQFTAEDVNMNRNVAIIGNDVIVKIFPHESPLDKKIYIKNQAFTVIGILETKGAVMGNSQDNRIIIPVSQFLKYFANFWEESLTITVKAQSKDALSKTMDETIGEMRTIRNVKPWEENSFELETNESLSEQFGNFTGFLFIFGLVSGAIALIAAGVGIMNIMLVSVKERTREIGVRKAVGARRRLILLQFIIETITFCQIGGIIGIIMGLGAGWLLSIMISIKLVFPILWIVLTIIICTVLGLVSGAYPAWKAAKLDPIEALRYE